MPPAEPMFCEAVEVVNSQHLFMTMHFQQFLLFFFLSFSLFPALTLLREGLQKGEDVYGGQLVATLRRPELFFSRTKLVALTSVLRL